MSRAAERPVETSRKGGPLERICCVCGSFDACEGVGPPMAPDERWYCGIGVSDCLPPAFFVGFQAAWAAMVWGRAG